MSSELADYLVGTVSASKLDDWIGCEARFKYRRIDRRREPKSLPIAFGRSADYAANALYHDKLSTGATATGREVSDRFAANFDVEADGISEWHGEKRGEVLDDGVRLLRLWREKLAVRVMPIEPPQSRFEIDLVSARPELDAELGIDSRYRLIGYRDLVADIAAPMADGTLATKYARKDIIVDLKTSARSWSGSEALKRTQPAAYQLASPSSPAFEFHILRRNLKTPKLQVIRRPLSDIDGELVKRRADATRRRIAIAVQTGDFLPNRQDRLCSRRYCSFWEQCQRDYGGTVL